MPSMRLLFLPSLDPLFSLNASTIVSNSGIVYLKRLSLVSEVFDIMAAKSTERVPPSSFAPSFFLTLITVDIHL